MTTMRLTRCAALVAAAVLAVGAGCSGDGDSDGDLTEATTNDPATSSDVADMPTADDGADAVVEPDGSETPGQEPSEPDDEPHPATTAAAPQGTPLVDGLPPIELLGPPETNAGTAPLFSWAAVDGATTYRLALLGPEGPIWSWTGEVTEVYLGGLEFAQPAGWAGPQLVDGSCWSVAARDAAGDVIAVSSFVPVSPGPGAGPACAPPGA